MLRFVMGAIAGGIAIWIWRDEVRGYVDQGTRAVRAKAADRLWTAQKATESALDTAKEHISAGFRTGREAIRPPMGKVDAVR